MKPWTNSLGMRFVPVPGAGVAFCVWETRVRDYTEFVRESRHEAEGGMFSLKNGVTGLHGHTWRNPGFQQTGEHPVVGVNWEDATAFCEWLTKKERGAGLLTSAQSYGLPTDDEWSRAAGLATAPGSAPGKREDEIERSYPWGTGWPPPKGAGNFCGTEARRADLPPDWEVIEGYADGFASTAPVGEFPANAHGIFDLSGNVWEWCQDSHDAVVPLRSVRGGSWLSGAPDFLLTTLRNAVPAGHRYVGGGFRCVLVLPTAL